MANTSTNVLGKLLAQGVLALRQNAVFPRLVNRSYENMAAMKQGTVINVPIPSSIAARAVTPSVVMNSNVAWNPTVALITLDHWYEAPFEITDSERAAVDPAIIPMEASEAVKALANDADAYGMGKHVGLYNFVGAAGTTPFASGVTLAGSARTVLNRSLAPIEDRFAILDPSADGNLLMTTNVLQFDQRGDQGGIIRGTIGTKLGFDWYMDQNVTTFTPGTGWVTGWALSTASGPAGSTTLNILNATASGTILVGDLFTVSGSTQQYVVTTAATASATVQVAIGFKPALATAVATGAALTVIATAYTVNLAANRYCFAWASRPLAGSLADGHVFQAPVDDISGIALRLELSRQYKLETLSYDYLAGSNVIREALGCKIFG